MGIEDDLRHAVKDGPTKSHEFTRQIERYRKFKHRMSEAGVVPKKQAFSIPLIARIGTVVVHDPKPGPRGPYKKRAEISK